MVLRRKQNIPQYFTSEWCKGEAMNLCPQFHYLRVAPLAVNCPHISVFLVHECWAGCHRHQRRPGAKTEGRAGCTCMEVLSASSRSKPVQTCSPKLRLGVEVRIRVCELVYKRSHYLGHWGPWLPSCLLLSPFLRLQCLLGGPQKCNEPIIPFLKAPSRKRPEVPV